MAATFVAFEIAAVSGTSLLFLFPDTLGTIALSRDTTASVACVLSEQEQTASGSAGVPATAVTGAWLLGLGLGRDAAVRQWASANQDVLVRSASGIQQLAGVLGAPPPQPFVPTQSANANREFVSFVEADRHGTAHALAVRYSPRACELFKVGTMWGYSAMVRPSLRGERAVFALEIRYHARRAGLPEPLWTPMLEPAAREASTEEVIAQTELLTNGVTSHLMGRR